VSCWLVGNYFKLEFRFKIHDNNYIISRFWSTNTFLTWSWFLSVQNNPISLVKGWSCGGRQIVMSPTRDGDNNVVFVLTIILNCTVNNVSLTQEIHS
jgi:hypothetical protein